MRYHGDLSPYCAVELYSAGLVSRRALENSDAFMMVESEASPSLWVTPEALSVPTEGRVAW